MCCHDNRIKADKVSITQRRPPAPAIRGHWCEEAQLMTISRAMKMGGLYSCTPRGPDMRHVHVRLSLGQSLGPGSRALSGVEGLTSFPSTIVTRSLSSHIPILSLNIQHQVNSLYSLLDNHTPSKTRSNILSSSRWSRPGPGHKEQMPGSRRGAEHECRGGIVSSAKVYLSSLLGYDGH